MTTEQLMEAINDIDDSLITETTSLRTEGERYARERRIRRRTVFVSVLSAAALIGIVLIVGGRTGLLRYLPQHKSDSTSSTPYTGGALMDADSAQEAYEASSDSVPVNDAVAESAVETVDSSNEAQSLPVTEEAPAAKASSEMAAVKEAADAAVSADGANNDEALAESTETESTAAETAGDQDLSKPPILHLTGIDHDYVLRPCSYEWTTRSGDDLQTTVADSRGIQEREALWDIIDFSEGTETSDPDERGFNLLTAAGARMVINEWEPLPEALQTDENIYQLTGSHQFDTRSKQLVETTFRKNCLYEVVATWFSDQSETMGGYGEARYIFTVTE